MAEIHLKRTHYNYHEMRLTQYKTTINLNLSISFTHLIQSITISMSPGHPKMDFGYFA